MSFDFSSTKPKFIAMKTENEFRRLTRQAKNLMINGHVKDYLQTLIRLHGLRNHSERGKLAQ